MEFKRFVDKGSDRVSTIEVDKWEPHPEKQGLVRQVGMYSYGEVFSKLKDHLEKMGMLPDEYFLPSYTHYNHNESLPEFDEAICYVNYGGSEGIYLNIMLSSYKNSNGPELVRFATGKTLSCDVEAYYKMSIICAECSMMLNGRGCSIRLGQENLKIEVSRVDKEIKKEDKISHETVDSIIADATAISKKNEVKDVSEPMFEKEQ